MSRQKAEINRSPVFIALIISAMIMMVLGIVVVSTRLEDKLRDSENEGDAPQEHINARRAEIIISEASEEEVIITEDGNEPLSMKSSGTYLNNRVLSVATAEELTPPEIRTFFWEIGENPVPETVTSAAVMSETQSARLEEFPVVTAREP